MAINKAVFEENWKEIRSQSTGRWNLMAEHDLVSRANKRARRSTGSGQKTLQEIRSRIPNRLEASEYPRRKEENQASLQGVRKHNRKVKQENRKSNVPGSESKKRTS